MNSINSKSPAQYSKSEDRVTAEFLKILQYGGHNLVAYLFGEDFDLPSNDVIVESQYYGNSSRPDGRISCDCNYEIFVESKIVANAINISQFNNHCNMIGSNSHIYLLYITPDSSMPTVLKGRFHVYWVSWNELVEKLEAYTKDASDRLLTYLVEEFKKTILIVVYHMAVDYMGLSEDRTLEDDNKAKEERVIIVGGRWGEDVALDYGVYICAPNRFFHPARYLAFCFNNRIKYLFEIVGDIYEQVNLKALPKLSADYFVKKEPQYTETDLRKVMFLKKVKEFDPEIENDSLDKNGNPCAYVQRQRYTTKDKIMSAKKTSDLN